MTPIGWMLMLCTWAIILAVMGMCVVRLLRAGKLTNEAMQEPEQPESR